LDDKAARRAALILQIPVTGTLGLLVAAARKKLLPSLRDAIEVVRASGLYVDSVIAAELTKEKH
jgi:predicted nucleic acid-binding protein